MEVSPMRIVALSAGLALAAAVWGTAPAAAQSASPAAASCLSDWGCSDVRPPLGLYVQAVDRDGQYITLEDGSLWEVEISDRALTAGWRPRDFVGIHTIAAPRGDFEILLTRAGYSEQRAAARLAGRRDPGAGPDEPFPGDLTEE
jgi:hypothetical protein